MNVEGIASCIVVCVGIVGIAAVAMQKDWEADLRSNGYVHIPHTVPPRILRRVLAQSIENLGICKNRQLGDIHHESSKRRDVHLTITPWVRLLVRHVWISHKDLWVSLVGENPLFYECSTLMTLPGARPQTWHRDASSMGPRYKKILSIGVLMQDTTEDMGALQVVPMTHLHNKDIRSATERKHKISVSGRAGDIVCWDANVHHRGGANASDSSRFVFYFTLASAQGAWPKGLTSSLRKEYRRHRHPRVCEIIASC